MTFTGSERPDPRRWQARALSTRPDMSYAAALRQVISAPEPWQPKHRWVLTAEVRRWLSGEGRRDDQSNLYAWLDNQVCPTFTCDLCGEPGDASTTDSSISPVVTAYDPDIAPVTHHLTTKKYHATCAPSSITWVPRTDVPPGPRYVDLPLALEPAVIGRLELDARALLDIDPEDGTRHAMLLLAVRVVEDHGRGAFPWLTELELYLGSQGIGRVHELDDDAEATWTLRIATDHATEKHRPWIAIRTRHGGDDEVPHHLLLRELDLPEGWAEAARRAGHVDVAVGPCTRHWDSAPVPEHLADGMADQMFGHQPGTTTVGERCGCAHLTADHAVELVEAGAFLTGLVRVLREDEIR